MSSKARSSLRTHGDVALRVMPNPKHPVLLLTEFGIGYQLAPESVDQFNFEARTPQGEDNGASSP